MLMSPMVREDILDLVDKGVTLTPDQIVTLNALGLRVTHGPDSANFVCAPRIGWAGKTPIYEPTIAMQRWLDDFGFYWWEGVSARLATAWAGANCNQPHFFADKTTEKATRRMIEIWQEGLDCTVSQLMSALNYALNGDEASVDDIEPPKQDSDADTETAEIEPATYDGCPYQEQVNEALAAGLGVSVAEIESHPRRIIADILRRWLRTQAALNGGDPSKLYARRSTPAWIAYEKYLATLKPKPEVLHGEG